MTHSSPSRRLEGRVAVVTGSSGGIGHAIANEFAREGASVVINSRDAGRAESAASAMEHEGLRASGFAADIRDPKQARALAEAAVERYGRLDVWVNNAGVNVIKPALELEPEEWAQVIDTNLSACFYGAQAAARLMVPQKSGVIIQIGSIIGEVGLPRRVPYTAAKHGLIGLTKALGTEWAKDNVRVVCLDPGIREHVERLVVVEPIEHGFCGSTGTKPGTGPGVERRPMGSPGLLKRIQIGNGAA